MSTPTNATAAPAAPAEAKEAKSFGTTLKDGAGNVMRLLASRTKSGPWNVRVRHISKTASGEPVSKVGASSSHESLAKAQTYVRKLTADAVALGWGESKAAGVGKKVVDAFDADNLPRPKPAPKEAKAAK